MIATLGTAN